MKSKLQSSQRRRDLAKNIRDTEKNKNNQECEYVKVKKKKWYHDLIF